MYIMRILIADQSLRVRQALSVFMKEQPGWEIVASAEDAAGVLLNVAKYNPDVLLLDWDLPGLDLDELLRAVHRLDGPLLVVALSARPELKPNIIGRGADYFVSKVDAPYQLVNTVQACEQRLAG